MEKSSVGLIGLGIMGKAYARNLLSKGFEVHGYDPVAANCDQLVALGGTAHGSTREVVAHARLIMLVLPSADALATVMSEIRDHLSPDHVLADMGTLPIGAKEAARQSAEAQRAAYLDCPVSGTGAQAEKADIVIYVSGDKAASARLSPVFEAISSSVRPVGAFGNGMKLKFIANLLVSIHNLAAAEALLLAERSGLDLQTVYDAIAFGGAATSRMFELRGPMMIAGSYEPATMKMDVFMKDVSLIMEHARDLRCPVPLMAASVPFYAAGLAQGRDKQDTAALFAVLQQLAAGHRDA